MDRLNHGHLHPLVERRKSKQTVPGRDRTVVGTLIKELFRQRIASYWEPLQSTWLPQRMCSSVLQQNM
jgi:hypothetical protein